jgi:hypothetical protein
MRDLFTVSLERVVSAVKTTQAIIIGVYGEGVQPGSAFMNSTQEYKNLVR